MPIMTDTSMFFEKYADRAVLNEANMYLLLKEISILPCLIKIAGTISAVNTAGAIKPMNLVNLGGISRFPEIIISGKRVQYVASPAPSIINIILMLTISSPLNHVHFDIFNSEPGCQISGQACQYSGNDYIPFAGNQLASDYGNNA